MGFSLFQAQKNPLEAGVVGKGVMRIDLFNDRLPQHWCNLE
jgi:hypothetical protein